MAIHHIVMTTIPAHGHINPFLSLAKLIIAHGFTITFAVPDKILADKVRHGLKQEEEAASISDPVHSMPLTSRIRVASLELSMKLPESSSCLAEMLEVYVSFRSSFENLLKDLLVSSCAPGGNISCIIADSVLTWSHEVGSQFSIPVFSFYGPNAHCFSTVVHNHSIFSKLASVQDKEERMDFIPGAEPLPARDLPESIRAIPSLVNMMFQHVSQVSGVILNTAYEIEQKTLDHIKNKLRVYTVGPLTLMLKFSQSTPRQVTHDPENLTEESNCLKWLDSKPDSSVLFVSFGTVAILAGIKMKELAKGLENSKQAFLWVIRTDNMNNDFLSNILPAGFLERTKERGLIVKWAPQLQVLSHRAIGGFVTHCGWNSIIENLSLGAVPMICWPQIADQRLNARILVDEWRVGLELHDESGIVKAEDIEKTVVDIIQGKIRQELKTRAVELRQNLFSAVQEGGTSRNDLESLMQDIRKPYRH